MPARSTPRRGWWPVLRAAFAAFALLASVVAGTGAGIRVQPALAAGGPWLDRFNAWRATVGVSTLTENSAWSLGDYHHSIYMVKNGLISHSEDPSKPYYTADGAHAAGASNIVVSSSTGLTDSQAIDWWMGAPFHALGMMDPRLATTGYGSYRDSAASPWKTGASVNVLDGNPFTGGSYPVYFPGNLSTEPLTSYSGNEFPDPLQACPGYSVPTGLPVFVQVGGNINTTVGPVHTFTANGTPLAHCVVDSHNSAVGTNLYYRGAVLLIPRSPLQVGITYTVALTVNSVPYTWSFKVGPLGACMVGVGGAPTVTAVTPRSGTTAGGTTTTIGGCGFSGATGVSFGSMAASSFTFVSDNEVTAVTPAEPGGTVDVTVTTALGTSATSTADKYQFTPPGNYTALAPTRVLDTRSGSPFGPGGSVNIPLAGTSVPSNATSVVLNMTAIKGSSSGWLTVYPTGGQLPNASNLNWAAGQTVANLVQVSLGVGGQVTINNAAGYTHVIADLEGYFAPPGGSTAGGFIALTPARITDTRAGSGLPNAGLTLHAGAPLDVQILGNGGVPLSGVSAIVLDATVTNTTATSWLTAFPTGSATPNASNLNWTAGKTVPNRVIVRIGPSGKVTFANAMGAADLLIDVNGYFTDGTASGTSNMGVVPARLLDTRNGTGGFSGKVGPGGVIALTVAGVGGVPAMGSSTPPTAVVVNVTVTNATVAGASWLTVWPSGSSMPNASDLNFVGGQVVANLAVVQVGPDGKIKISNANGSTDVIVDVVAWFG